MGFFDRLKEGLQKTKTALVEKINTVITTLRPIDEALFEELEEVLIQGDVGVDTTEELIHHLRQEAKRKALRHAEELQPVLREKIADILGQPAPMQWNPNGVTVIMVVGVNGVGKTTTIGKLAHHYRQQGKRVLVAAADTFRAAAIDQLQVWAERAGAGVIAHAEGSDPAAVAYDAVKAAQGSRRADVVLIDTAGRLHNKTHLMEELRKIKRVIARDLPGAPHEVLLVLDATTGQNAVQQAKLFKEVTDVTGLALTKLDGTAKGGVVIAVKHAEGVPVKWIGVGEQMDDLQPFNPSEFVAALFGPR